MTTLEHAARAAATAGLLALAAPLAAAQIALAGPATYVGDIDLEELPGAGAPLTHRGLVESAWKSAGRSQASLSATFVPVPNLSARGMLYRPGEIIDGR